MLLAVVVFTNLFAAVSLSFTPVWARPGTYFGVRVPPEYKSSPEAHRSRRSFLIKVWAATAAAVALSLLRLPWLGFVIQVGAATLAFRAGWRATRPHGVEAPTERTAQLFGPRAAVPGGAAAVGGPFVVVAAAFAYLLLKWNSIPARFPVHWDLEGHANGWSTRTPAGVFGPLLIAFAVLVLLAAVTAAQPHKGRRGLLVVPVIVMWIIAIMFSLVALTPLILRNGQFPIPMFVMILIPIAAIAVGIWITARESAQPGDSPDYTPNECWKWGQIYYNPDDPSIWVEKRFGLGYTFNFARWQSWALLAGLLGLPLAISLIAS